MKKERWQRAVKSTKRKRKPGEFNFMHELEPHLRGPGQNRWGGQQNVRLTTFKGKFGKATEGHSLTPEQIHAWKKENGLA